MTDFLFFDSIPCVAFFVLTLDLLTVRRFCFPLYQLYSFTSMSRSAVIARLGHSRVCRFVIIAPIGIATSSIGQPNY